MDGWNAGVSHHRARLSIATRAKIGARFRRRGIQPAAPKPRIMRAKANVTGKCVIVIVTVTVTVRKKWKAPIMPIPPPAHKALDLFTRAR